MKISVITPSIRPEGLKATQETLETQTFSEFEWLVEMSLTNKQGSDLNAAYNRAIKRAKGELIVSLQDYTKIMPDGLQKFWDAHQKEPAFYTAPLGKVSKWDDDPVFDWRKSREKECNWQEWEIDWGSAPRQALVDIGGFDEELDSYWGFDNVNVGLRANMAGWKFYNIPDNLSIALDHNAFMDHPHKVKRNPDFHNDRLDCFRHGGTIAYI